MDMGSTETYCFCGKLYDKNEFMVQCDYCKGWFHGSCVNVKEYKVIEIDKYFCPRCTTTCGPSILKIMTNLHRHDFWDVGAAGKPVQTGTFAFIQELCSRHFSSEGEIVTHMRGQQLTEPYLRQNGFDSPIVIDGKDGLDMTVPPNNFSIFDVEQNIGGDREIDVIDVPRQTDFKMTLRDFVEYFNTSNRTRIFNVISLEFSEASLSELVEAPLVVRRLDWVNSVWPRDMNGDKFEKPQVQKYCLMSVKDSYTDFHIDFGGTSVWYHVLRGEKVFYFIRPTPANLTLYQQWMTSSSQSETFFGDQVDQCFKCILRQGQTMLIPTGWIHAVYTPQDSLVFGGNFLHSLNIPMQLQIYDIEKKIKTVEKFKFPLFETINWYAAKRLLQVLKELNGEEKNCPSYLLVGVKALLTVLKQWNTEKDYNMSNREQIPDIINSHKLLKDLGKEIRHTERFLLSLNPPKPERESKRKRKRPVNKDFVDFSSPQRLYEPTLSSSDELHFTSPKKSRLSSSSTSSSSKSSAPPAKLYPNFRIMSPSPQSSQQSSLSPQTPRHGMQAPKQNSPQISLSKQGSESPQKPFNVSLSSSSRSSSQSSRSSQSSTSSPQTSSRSSASPQKSLQGSQSFVSSQKSVQCSHSSQLTKQDSESPFKSTQCSHSSQLSVESVASGQPYFHTPQLLRHSSLSPQKSFSNSPMSSRQSSVSPQKATPFMQNSHMSTRSSSESPQKSVTLSQSSNSSLPTGSSTSYTSSPEKWSDYSGDPTERWTVTNVDTGGAVLKFTLDSKGGETVPQPGPSNSGAPPTEETGSDVSVTDHTPTIDYTAQQLSLPKSVYDFHDDSDNREDEFALKIDETPDKKKRASAKTKAPAKSIHFNVNPSSPKNGIESLLKASAIANKYAKK